MRRAVAMRFLVRRFLRPAEEFFTKSYLNVPQSRNDPGPLAVSHAEPRMRNKTLWGVAYGRITTSVVA